MSNIVATLEWPDENLEFIRFEKVNVFLETFHNNFRLPDVVPVKPKIRKTAQIQEILKLFATGEKVVTKLSAIHNFKTAFPEGKHPTTIQLLA